MWQKVGKNGELWGVYKKTQQFEVESIKFRLNSFIWETGTKIFIVC